ncbi:hypothetical protein RHGRI_004338 [Rhododendron griersonianum]|uniref:Uncharacterized protein n=1 Tax=Rhododendron griersonianum TaxID=479676 RepID=A0AAV6L988_9ERIC|nr:hypothetical protein RHGRI_004338 [Rhododendron griersonianum]
MYHTTDRLREKRGTSCVGKCGARRRFDSGGRWRWAWTTGRSHVGGTVVALVKVEEPSSRFGEWRGAEREKRGTTRLLKSGEGRRFDGGGRCRWALVRQGASLHQTWRGARRERAAGCVENEKGRLNFSVGFFFSFYMCKFRSGRVNPTHYMGTRNPTDKIQNPKK